MSGAGFELSASSLVVLTSTRSFRSPRASSASSSLPCALVATTTRAPRARTASSSAFAPRVGWIAAELALAEDRFAALGDALALVALLGQPGDLGKDAVAPLPDQRPDALEGYVVAGFGERRHPGAGVGVVGIDQGSVDVEEYGLSHGERRTQRELSRPAFRPEVSVASTKRPAIDLTSLLSGAAKALGERVGPLPNVLSKRSKTLRPRIAEAKKTPGICPYCAVGCGTTVYSRGNGDPRHRGQPRLADQRRHALPEGRGDLPAAREPEPLDDGEVPRAVPSEWADKPHDWAMERIAQRVKETRDETFIEHDDARPAREPHHRDRVARRRDARQRGELRDREAVPQRRHVVHRKPGPNMT